jgi:hypothetical protein
LVEKPKRKRSLQRRKHRWEDGIRMDHGRLDGGDMEWIQLAQGIGWWQAVANSVMSLWVVVPRS